jgi:YL1 nuclear protein C-terminal domain
LIETVLISYFTIKPPVQMLNLKIQNIFLSPQINHPSPSSFIFISISNCAAALLRFGLGETLAAKLAATHFGTPLLPAVFHSFCKMSSAARKAWNEAMKVTAGGAALPPSLQQRPLKRRSDRNKKQERRAKARKVSLAVCDAETEEYRSAVWIDALEGVDPNIEAAEVDDDEFNELDELDASSGGGGGKKSSNKRRRTTASKAAKTKPGVVPKRFLPRSFASILIEEASREDSAAKAFLNAQARLPKSAPQLPRRKFCPVTGVSAKYTESKSGIPYSNLKALEQIRERPPPWMVLGGSAAYMEAVKSIQEM